MANTNWQADLTTWIRTNKGKRPPMPFMAQVGYCIGISVGTVTNLAKAIPGVSPVLDGYTLGKARADARALGLYNEKVVREVEDQRTLGTMLGAVPATA